jgi:GMP synthase-like glutamine amidotransferase
MIFVVDMNYKPDSLGFHEFVLPIVSVVKELDGYVVKHFSELRNSDLNECNGIILSGTPLKDNASLSQPEKFKWIRTCEKPMLGICAGMQTICLAFGLKLKPCLGIGMTDITTTTENQLFAGTFKAYTLHNFSVDPEGEFEVLAQSSQCAQAIRHTQRSIYGVLFHPEVRNLEILRRFTQQSKLNPVR